MAACGSPSVADITDDLPGLHLLAELRITEECIMLPESHELESCLCFNYFENGTLINTKYRSGRKHFMMVKGAELIPYNIDAILDLSLIHI